MSWSGDMQGRRPVGAGPAPDVNDYVELPYDYEDDETLDDENDYSDPEEER